MKFINKIKEYVSKINKRKFGYISFFWSIISIQFILGSNMQNKGHLFGSTSSILIDIVKFILMSIIFVSLHYCILELINRIQKRQKIEKKETEKINNKKYRWLIYFLTIFACWIPTVLAFYPSIVGYDGGYQIRNYFLLNEMTHHPILITKIYTFFYVIGLMIKSPTVGMFLFSLTQMAFMAASFSYAVKFIEDETQNKLIRNISILFYALYPYNQLFAITTTKDVILAGLMLIFVIHLYKMLKEKFKITDYIFLVLIGVVMLLSRNNTIYTLEVSLPFIILVLIKERHKLVKIVTVFLLIIILYKSANNCLYKMLKNQSANSQNNEGNFRLSIFTQAVGRVARDNKDSLTQEEKEKISYYFKDYEKLGKVYAENIADITANEMASGKNINKNKKEFFTFVLELGKKYPMTYIESFLDTARGYWYIEDVSFSNILIYNHPGAFELYDFGILGGSFKVKHESKIEPLKNLYTNLYCLNRYQEVPVLYTLFQPGIFFYLTLAFLLYAMYKKDKDNLVIAIFLFIFYASCYLAFCSIIRYMYPIMVNTPIMLALVLKNKEQGEEK